MIDILRVRLKYLDADLLDLIHINQIKLWVYQLDMFEMPTMAYHFRNREVLFKRMLNDYNRVIKKEDKLMKAEIEEYARIYFVSK